MSSPKIWISEIRAPFLLLPLIFVLIGVTMAWRDGFFNPVYALLTLIGVVCLHAAANILNDYFDYRSGIDLHTTRTPFSGGSGILTSNKMTPRNVLFEGILFLVIGLSIGGYFLYTLEFNPILIFIMAFAVLGIILYSPTISRFGIGEFVVALMFGPLLLFGVYFVQTMSVSVEPILIGAVTGILTSSVLYINEFPDHDSDKKMGRLHLVARMGKKSASKKLKYIFALAYVLIIAGVVLQIMPIFSIIGLATIPLARKSYKILEGNYDENTKLIPGMASTIFTAILTGLILSLANIMALILI